MRALIAGSLLGGKWRIVRPALGDEPGSECRVESALDARAGRLTLWRTLRPPTAVEQEALTRLLGAGERTGCAALPPVEEVGYDGARESLWGVRPWWNGESLPSMLGGLHEQGLDLPDLYALAEQLAGALESAHGAGLVHGRLRPSRVLVAWGPTGARLSLLDLGLELFRREQAFPWLRTPGVGRDYLAPEFTPAGPLPPSTDVFAFGLLVRDLLATRKDGAWLTRGEVWTRRATAPSPSERFPSMREAMQALRPVLQALPMSPPPPTNDPPATLLVSP